MRRHAQACAGMRRQAGREGCIDGGREGGMEGREGR